MNIKEDQATPLTLYCFFSGLFVLFRTHLAIIHKSVSHADGDDIVDVETCVGVDDQRHCTLAHQHLRAIASVFLIQFDLSVLVCASTTWPNTRTRCSKGHIAAAIEYGTVAKICLTFKAGSF